MNSIGGRRIGIFGVSLLVLLGVWAGAEAEAQPGSGTGVRTLQELMPKGPLSPQEFPHAQMVDRLLALKAGGDRVRVIIEMSPQADGLKLLEQLQGLGAEVELTYESWIQAFIPTQELLTLRQMPGVEYVRLPVSPMMDQGPIVSEGALVVGTPSWQQAGWTGRGVKVGLIDPGGFRDYERLLGRELPPRERVVARSFRSDGLMYNPDISRSGQVHGTATAEIVHDIAPEAQLYLVMFSTDLEFRRAIDWLIAERVDVINTSLGIFSGCFRSDGGMFEPQFKKARQSGVTWVTASGNEADVHWQGDWSDPEGNNLLNFSGSDEGNTLDVRLVEFQYPDGRRVATSIVDVLFAWDAPCTGASDDYEVIVLREDGKPLAPWSGEQGQISDWVWRPGVPIKETFASEDFEVSRVGEIVKYHLAIRKKRSSAPDARSSMLIGCPCSRIEYLKPEGSVFITEPSISPNVITVGAVHHSGRCSRSLCPDGKLLVYSSQGPTRDGRIKPDLTAPSHVSTSSYGRWTGDSSSQNPGFTGTSAAAPHAAGAAALVKQAFPEYTPEQIQQFLERGAEDLGDAGKDNRYGAGILFLGQPPARAPTITGISPSSGRQGSTIQATISGTNLSGATSVSFSGAGVTAVLGTGGSNTALPITLTIAADAPPGARTFSVTTPAGVAESGRVTFTVLEALRLEVEPLSLKFQATVGEGDPPSQTMSLTSSGEGTLSWRAEASVPWILLSASEGTAPAEIEVSVSLAGLSAGTHEGRITLQAEGAINSPLVVPVTLELLATPGELLALKFKWLEFVEPDDWQRQLREGCVVYTNVSGEKSLVRVTLVDEAVRAFEIPAGNEVLVCGDVVHIDTRTRPPQPQQ